MSQQLMLHRAVKVVQSRHEFPQRDESKGFFKLEFVVTDRDGSEITIIILSDAYLRIEEES